MEFNVFLFLEQEIYIHMQSLEDAWHLEVIYLLVVNI
jgi:hypothetical protein